MITFPFGILREFTEADLHENRWMKPQVTGSSKVLVLSLLGLAGFPGLAGAGFSLFHPRGGPSSRLGSGHPPEIAQDYRAALAKGDLGSAWNLAPKPGMPPFPRSYHLGMMGPDRHGQ